MLGYSVAAAWELTPAEMHTCVDAIRAQRRDRAWWTWWSIAPHIDPERRPTLEQLTGEADLLDTNRPMTADEWADLRATFERAYPGSNWQWPSIKSS